MRIIELATELRVDPAALLRWLKKEGFVDSFTRSISAEITNGHPETVKAAFQKCGGVLEPKTSSLNSGLIKGRVTKAELLGGSTRRYRINNPLTDWLGAPKKGQSLRSPNSDFGDWIERRRDMKGTPE